MVTLWTMVGLSVAQLTQGTIVGNLGFSDVAFPKPLFHGDTLYAETVVVDKRESKSRPGEGVVTFAHTAPQLPHPHLGHRRRGLVTSPVRCREILRNRDFQDERSSVADLVSFETPG